MPAGKFLTIFPDFLNPRNPPAYKIVKTKTSSPSLEDGTKLWRRQTDWRRPLPFIRTLPVCLPWRSPCAKPGLASDVLLSDGLFELFEDGPGLGYPIARRALPVELSVAGDLFFDFFARH